MGWRQNFLKLQNIPERDSDTPKTPWNMDETPDRIVDHSYKRKSRLLKIWRLVKASAQVFSSFFLIFSQQITVGWFFVGNLIHKSEKYVVNLQVSQVSLSIKTKSSKIFSILNTT